MLVLGLVQVGSLAAQSESKEWVVLNNGDTLYGKVKDRKEVFFAKIYPKVRFKANGKMVGRRYSPNQILAYQCENRHYESKWLKVESILIKEKYWTIEKLGKRTFLRVIVSDQLSLYHLEWMDQDGRIIEYVELLHKRGEREMARASQGLFGLKKQVLSEYLKDYPGLVEKINKGEVRTAFEVAREFNRR